MKVGLRYWKFLNMLGVRISNHVSLLLNFCPRVSVVVIVLILFTVTIALVLVLAGLDAREADLVMRVNDCISDCSLDMVEFGFVFILLFSGFNCFILNCFIVGRRVVMNVG